MFIDLQQKHASLLQIVQSVKFFIKLNLQASHRVFRLAQIHSGMDDGSKKKTSFFDN